MNDQLLIRECLGCGYCCLKSPCMNAFIYDWIKDDRCTQLYWSPGKKRYFCKMIEKYPSFADFMAAGSGCSSSLNTWRKDIKERG